MIGRLIREASRPNSSTICSLCSECIMAGPGVCGASRTFTGPTGCLKASPMPCCCRCRCCPREPLSLSTSRLRPADKAVYLPRKGSIGCGWGFGWGCGGVSVLQATGNAWEPMARSEKSGARVGWDVVGWMAGQVRLGTRRSVPLGNWDSSAWWRAVRGWSQQVASLVPVLSLLLSCSVFCCQGPSPAQTATDEGTQRVLYRHSRPLPSRCAPGGMLRRSLVTPRQGEQGRRRSRRVAMQGTLPAGGIQSKHPTS